MLPLWLFLALQAGTGIWWMATISADVRSITREVERMNTRQEVMDLKFEKFDKNTALFEQRVKMSINLRPLPEED